MNKLIDKWAEQLDWYTFDHKFLVRARFVITAIFLTIVNLALWATIILAKDYLLLVMPLAVIAGVVYLASITILVRFSSAIKYYEFRMEILRYRKEIEKELLVMAEHTDKIKADLEELDERLSMLENRNFDTGQ